MIPRVALVLVGLAVVVGNVLGVAPAEAATVDAGRYHSCAVLSGGGVACWGDDSAGQLGNGGTDWSTTAVAVSGVTSATAVSTGGYHSCALLADGEIECWGDNASGALGNGEFTAPPWRPPPVPVSGISNATAVSAGELHTCALLADGTIGCWGSNSDGQLGNGTTTRSSTPVAVSGLSGATSISAGHDFTCAVISGGGVVCWGNNSRGQLGNGTTTQSSTPVAVSGIANAATVTAGRDRACAVLLDGSVACWGKGDLGDGTFASSSTPVAVSGITNATAVSAGEDHTCATLSDGGVACWGAGGDGQLGNGAYAESTTPVAVSGLTGVTSLGAGSWHTCAALSGARVACWGVGTQGDLGNGASTKSATPVMVRGLTLPPPIFGRTINVEPVSGVVRIEVAGSNTFVPLTSAVSVPLGSTIDTSDGKVKLTAAKDRASHIQTGLFDSGVFSTGQVEVRARGALAGITVLTLTGALDCASTGASRVAAGHATVRQLWGVSTGSFRTKGRYASATVRGTRWNVKDTCGGTLVTVASGAVAVDDFVHHRTIVLRAPHSIFIRPGGEAKQSIRAVVASVERLLASLKQGRTRLGKALGGAVACSMSLHAAGNQIDDVIQNRAAIRADLGSQSAPSAAAKRAIALLRTALDHSLAADRHYRTWLADLESSHASCPLPHGQAFDAARREDAKATAAKQRFVRVFNPIARRQHLRTWKADEF